MEYEKYYELSWTWHYVNSFYCYSEYKVFETEEEVNKYVFDLFHNLTISVVWCEKKCVEKWENTFDKSN